MLERVGLERFVTIAADAIITVDRRRRIISFNHAAEQIFGWTQTEVLNRPLDVLIPDRFRHAHRGHVRGFAAGDDASVRMEDRHREIVGLRKNGEEFPAEAAISKLDDGGELLAVVLRDITQRVQAEREQRLLAEVSAVLAETIDYEATLTNIADLAVRDLADCCLVDVIEGGVARRLRVSHRDPSKAGVAEVLEKIPLDRMRPHLFKSVFDSKQATLVERVSDDLIETMAQSESHASSLRALEIESFMAVPLLARGALLGALLFVSSTPGRRYSARDVRLAADLAHRAALAFDAAKLYRAAREAIRARDDVLGVVAHDLRNPLSSIQLTAKVLARRRMGRFTADEQGDIEVILRASERANRLIQDLLDVTRMEAGALTIERVPVPVWRALAEVVESQRPNAAARSVELVLAGERVAGELRADPHRLAQVLENLMGNAIKFTRPGGRVTVAAAASRDEVVFCVKDTGAGISAGALPHVFDRFWQSARADRRGAGLGLSICKAIVEAHGAGSAPRAPRARAARSPSASRGARPSTTEGLTIVRSVRKRTCTAVTMERRDGEPEADARRRFLGAVAGIALTACATTRATHGERSGEGGGEGEAEVTPGEDLMQEHGVVERVLLVYDETARRIERGEAFDGAVVRGAADIVRRFVEDYHEHTEEQFVFPRLEAARREVELVATLRRQHQRGRGLTDDIVRLSQSPAGAADLARALRAFERMYRPHAAREDTVVFPAFRQVVGRGAYRELGERFEEQEHARFGERGFERTVAEVARLEAALGIDDLARFTPP